MTITLRISGPGLDVTKTLAAGDPALILGRDADCSVCLPDPLRNVSRRHLSVWNEGGELHFHVLSVVNGIEMPFGEAPPGARGVLPAGQALKLAEYTVSTELPAGNAAPPALEAAAEPDDPWAVFDRDASGVAPVPEGLQSLNARPASAERIEEDPFGDWGFETTFGPGGVAGAALEAGSLNAARDLEPLFRGLGLQGARLGALSEGELEAIGRLMRVLVLGLLQLQAAALRSQQELKAEDRTLVGARGGINPLKADAPPEDKLRYVFGGRGASAGFIAPERAVAELLAGLLSHEQGARAGARAAVEGTLREFDPESLKPRILAGSARLFESVRAWDAYARFYTERRGQLPQWAQEMLDRYYAEAYLRETRGTRG